MGYLGHYFMFNADSFFLSIIVPLCISAYRSIRIHISYLTERVCSYVLFFKDFRCKIETLGAETIALYTNQSV